MSRFEVYTYTCSQHAIGAFVRDVLVEERNALKLVAQIRPHFTNCWVKGCQMPLSQVRIVKDGDPANAQAAGQEVKE